MDRKQIEAAAGLTARCNYARDLGRDHYRTTPDAMLVAVYRLAQQMYPEDQEVGFAFVEGFVQARRKHDDYKRGD